MTGLLGLVLIPLLASPVVYLLGRLYCRRMNPDGACALGRWLGFAVLLATWLPYVQTLMDFQARGTLTFTLGLVSLRADGISLLMAAVVLTLSTLVMLYSGPYMAGEHNEEKYYAMLVAMSGAMIGLSMAADLFNLWVWFETMAITSYLLVAFYRDLPHALEAGVKYMLQSATGSALVLFGIALVLAQTGTLDLAKIRAVSDTSPLLLAAGALFVVGFGVKAALVPLHTWLPDAHSQAPSGISALLSGVVIEAGLLALLRSVAALAGVTSTWGVLLMGLGAINMLLGNLMALRQTQIKRMLAYSSLSHVGYMLLGLGIAFYAGQANGAQGSLFHLLNHGLMKGLAFLAAGTLLYSLHAASGDHAPLVISDLSGAAQRYPWVALTLSIALLGLGGMPPLAGFMSKWQIFTAGFGTHNGWIMALVIFAAFNSVLSLGYYAPLINTMYRRQPSAVIAHGKSVPFSMLLPLLLLAAAVIVLGFYPALLNSLTQPAGAALMQILGG